MTVVILKKLPQAILIQFKSAKNVLERKAAGTALAAFANTGK